MARFDRQAVQGVSVLFSDLLMKPLMNPLMNHEEKMGFFISAGLVECLFSGEKLFSGEMFFWFEVPQLFEPSFQQEMTKRYPCWIHVWKGHPKWWNRNLTEKLGPEKLQKLRFGPFRHLSCYLSGYLSALEESLPRNPESRATGRTKWCFIMFLYPVAKPKNLFTGFPPLGSFLLAQKFTALRMTPSALAGIPSHLLRNATAYSFAMSHEHHSKPFAAAPFPFGGSAFGSGA